MTTTKENYIGAIVGAVVVGIIGTWIVITVQQLEGPAKVVTTGSSDVLQGLKGVKVLVESLPEGLMKIGLSNTDVTTKVEFALRRNGIRVFTKEESNSQKGVATLYVNLNCIDEVINLSVSCQENVLLSRASGTTVLNTEVWDKEVMAYHVDNKERVSDLIGEYVDMFSNDYLKANPK
jgi:hypothetical protein